MGVCFKTLFLAKSWNGVVKMKQEYKNVDNWAGIWEFGKM